MQTHLLLVKLIEQKRLENGGETEPEDAEDEGEWLDSPEAFMAAMGN